ncbi:MAG: hypothetical protein ACMXYL_05195 [Candidatus Woesearchaeota archaeon]
MVIRNKGLDNILSMDYDMFRSLYSKPEDMKTHSLFYMAEELEPQDRPIYPVTNELDYAQFCKNNPMPQGGIHVGIAGGLQPFLYQGIRGNTELSIACDISGRQIELLEDTLSMIGNNTGRKGFITEYAEKYNTAHDSKAKIMNIWGLLSDYDYKKLRRRVSEGRYKGMEGNMLTSGLPLALDISRDTRVKVNIIYLSSIRDMAEYQAGKNQYALTEYHAKYQAMDRKIRDAKNKELFARDGIIIEYDTDFKAKAKKQRPKTRLRRIDGGTSNENTSLVKKLVLT